MNQQYPSQLLADAVEEVSKLPGIGKKTALRLVLHLLRQENQTVYALADSLKQLKDGIQYCKVCCNICDDEICSICAEKSRDAGLICVVENIKEVMAIENTMQFKGLYHVLGGLISPMDGIGPTDLNIDELVKRVEDGGIREVILALSTTMEGETTNFFIFKKLQAYDVKVSIIARGISIGDEIEYADEVTLGQSILNRTLFNDSFKKH